MSNVVSIHPYFKIHEGKLEAFKALLPQFTAKTATEAGCHWYDFSICGDMAHCREAYDGAEGLLVHLANVEEQIAAALVLSELVRVEVHGSAAELEKLKEPLADMGPEYYIHQIGIGKP